MATVFFSNKLATLLNIPKSRLTAIPTEDNFSLWNAQLFSVDKRKCLIVTNKKTLYSFVALDILKKDIEDFKTFFIDRLFRQLQHDNLLTTELKTLIEKDFQAVNLLTTDNDKKTIGSMNDYIYHTKDFIYRKSHISHVDSYSIAGLLNDIPMGALKYAKPIERVNKLFSPSVDS